MRLLSAYVRVCDHVICNFTATHITATKQFAKKVRLKKKLKEEATGQTTKKKNEIEIYKIIFVKYT